MHRSKSLLWAIAFTLLFLPPALAHEHWIDMEDFTPTIGTPTKIFICSGHAFPKSRLALADRVVTDTRIIAQSGTESTYTTKKKKLCRAGEIYFKEDGVQILTFSLKRPPLKEPVYCAKAIALAGKQKKGIYSYRARSLIEIVPQKPIVLLKKGQKLPLKLLCRNKTAKNATFQVSIDGKKNFFLRTDKDGVAILRIKRSGRYLITASHKGKGCSLTFYVPKTTGRIRR